MLTLKEILGPRSQMLDGKKVKIVRHQDNRAEYRDLIKDRQGLLEYQKEQANDVFGNCDYIISFRGLDRCHALFFGVFSVGERAKRNGMFYYDLAPVPCFNDLIDRLVINWGDNARAWHQWYDRHDKEVMEILPRGYIGNFPGLLNFVLDHDELKTLVSNPDANHEWRRHLSAVNGIYMILDTKAGQQYIGSANGNAGIWQRWCDYAVSGTGGNTELTALHKADPDYARHFKYSVLQTLPSNITKVEIDKIEALYKEKFGTRAHGLNRN